MHLDCKSIFYFYCIEEIALQSDFAPSKDRFSVALTFNWSARFVIEVLAKVAQMK